MQKFLIGLFALFLIAVQVRPLVVFVHFKMNQSYISQELCENKNRPKLNCNGKCYLMKKIERLEQKKKAEASQTPVMPDWEEERIPLFSEESEVYTFLSVSSSSWSTYDDWYLLPHHLKPDTPPPDLG